MINIDYDLNALKIFMAVYENNGIEKASRKLFLTQPAVSISIKKLEEKLGGKLFKRLPKGITPTEEGHNFYNECKNGLTLLNGAFLNFSKENALKEGSLKIGASTAIIKHILMPVVIKFSEAYPNIKISFTEVIANRLERYLGSGEIDLAFMEEPIEHIHAYETKEVCVITNCFVVKRDDNKDELDLKEMQNSNFAVLKNNTNHRALFEALCLKNNLPLKVKYEMASFETLSEVCKNGLAVGFTIKEFIEDELKSGKLKVLKTPIWLPSCKVFALLPKTKSSGFVCEKFLEFMIK